MLRAKAEPKAKRPRTSDEQGVDVVPGAFVLGGDDIGDVEEVDIGGGEDDLFAQMLDEIIDEAGFDSDDARSNDGDDGTEVLDEKPDQPSASASVSSSPSAPLHYLDGASASMVSSIVDTLSAGCSDGRATVRDSFDFALHHSKTTIEVGTMSLIQYSKGSDEDGVRDSELIFVRWESTRGNPRRARRVRLDSEGRIVYNVPFMVVVEEFSVENTLILISTLSVDMLKLTQRFRPNMPRQVVFLKRHYLAKLFPGPMLVGPESLEEDRCKVFQLVLARLLVERAFSTEHEVYVCSSCLCS